MQYSIYINQERALEWGLNASQAILFGFLYEVPSWADPSVIDGQTFFRIAKSKISEELPLLTDKPDTVYRLMKALVDTGLIKKVVHGETTYIKITAKGALWNRSNIDIWSEKNPGTPGKKSAPPLGKKSDISYYQ